jgi:hypothetical protein
MSNARARQRSSEHLVVRVRSTTQVGGAVISRTSWEVNRNGLGCMRASASASDISERPLGESQGENRNREIRPSGIVGGPRETCLWWDCEPASQSKERARKPLTSQPARPSLYPDHILHGSLVGAKSRPGINLCRLLASTMPRRRCRPHLADETPGAAMVEQYSLSTLGCHFRSLHR